MTRDKAAISPQAPAPEHLAETFRDLRLSLGMEPGFTAWSDLHTPDSVRERMQAHSYIDSTMSPKTQAAYYLNRLANCVMGWVSWLDLAGYRLDGLWHGDLQVNPVWVPFEHNGQSGSFLSYAGNMPELPSVCRPGHTSPPEPVGQGLLALWSPLVASLAEESKLSPGALWRLVTDAVAAAYLTVGARVGCRDLAMQHARDLITQAGKPLDNRQWDYLKVTVPASESPNGETLEDWFRVRGGCCRHYTLNGTYCGTCVLLSDAEYQQRFSKALCHRARGTN